MDRRGAGVGRVVDGDPVADGGEVGRRHGLVAEAAGDLGGALAALRVDDVRAAMLRGHARRREPAGGVRLELFLSARAPPERGQLEQPESPLCWQGLRTRSRAVSSVSTEARLP